MLGHLREYDGKPLNHIAKGELPLDEAEKAKQEEASQAAAPLLERIKGLLGDRVEDVRVSARPTDSPSCLALSDRESAPHLAPLQREAGRDVPDQTPSRDINPQPPRTRRLRRDHDDARAGDMATQ